jgi:hypothetical protein
MKPYRFAVLILAGLLAACGGGSGGSNGAVPAIVASSPTPAPQSTTISVQPGSQSALLPAAGYSGSISLPAATSGTGSVSATLSMTPPGSLVALQGFRRATSVGTSALVYLSLSSSHALSFGSFPTLSFTLPAAPVAGASYYLAFFDGGNPSLGWQGGFIGPAVISGSTLSFTAPAQTLTLTPGAFSIFALYILTAPTATPSSAPTPTTAPTTAPNAPAPSASPSNAAPAPQASGSSAPAAANTLTGIWLVYGNGLGGTVNNPGMQPYLNLPNIALMNFTSASVSISLNNTGIISISGNSCPSSWNFQVSNVTLPGRGTFTNVVAFTADRTSLNCAFTLTDGGSGESVRVLYANT